MNELYQDIVDYHDRTKHHYHRFAQSPGYLDWETQPNPFRFYEGTNRVQLPFLKECPNVHHLGIYKREPKTVSNITLESFGGFLELSLALSAWKQFGNNQWSLRINPSSGNLHPTEAHVILPQIDSQSPGVYHYNPLLHVLEKRAEIPGTLWDELITPFNNKGFFIALTGIFWRESWKYGERAFRYCNHDIGHALSCLSFAANLFGWKLKSLNSLSDKDIKNLLGLDHYDWVENEEEHPDILCYISPISKDETPNDISLNVIQSFSRLEFLGKPNQLSNERVNWNIINTIAEKTYKRKTSNNYFEPNNEDIIKDRIEDFIEDKKNISASKIIRQRRSAAAFDGKTFISKDQLINLLDKTLPKTNHAPFDLGLMDPSTHLLLFIHRVTGLEPGIYFFIRNNQHINELKSLCDSQFLWELASDHLPLYLLQTGNYQNEAKSLSCQQDIAGDSSFSLGMIARFQKTIENAPYRYRHLFWETGMIGQVLYLEAEVIGVRGTGIGCFFDDEVHNLLGLKDHQYQSLYHFTIGGPVEDLRLSTLEAYYHLKQTGEFKNN